MRLRIGRHRTDLGESHVEEVPLGVDPGPFDAGHDFVRFVRERRLGRVLIAPFDVVLSETDVVQPDILFVAKDRAAIIRDNGVFGAPDLVIEVLSPATAQRDRTVKAKLYARAGVKELWLVDPEARTIRSLRTAPMDSGKPRSPRPATPLLPRFSRASGPSSPKSSDSR